MLKKLLADRDRIIKVILRPEEERHWETLDVDYNPPRVERLWREWDGGRLFLHRIHRCEPGEALVHNHAWPAAMWVLSGEYEMPVWYAAKGWEAVAGGNDAPIGPLVTNRYRAGSTYEMVDRNTFHAVYPTTDIALSIMLTGPKWEGGWTPYPLGVKPKTELKQLADARRSYILDGFAGALSRVSLDPPR